MSPPPAVLLVQADEGARAGLAAALRRDGMDVVEFAVAEQALAALGRGLNAAVLATEPALGRLTDLELAEQAKDAVSEITIILTPDPAAGRLDTPLGGALPRQALRGGKALAIHPPRSRQARAAWGLATLVSRRASRGAGRPRPRRLIAWRHQWPPPILF